MVNHADAADYQVITFSEEPRLAYDRVQLSKYFSGSTAEDLMLTSENYYNEKNVQFILICHWIPSSMSFPYTATLE